MSFPIPNAQTFPWDVPLNRHLAQLNNPLTGGINTWATSPSIGVDGQTLSSRHEGYTGFNTTSGSLERWSGSAWVNLTITPEDTNNTEDNWSIVTSSPFTSTVNSKNFVNPTGVTTFNLPNKPLEVGQSVIVAVGASTNLTRYVRVVTSDSTINSNGTSYNINEPNKIIEFIYSGITWLAVILSEEITEVDPTDPITIIDGGSASSSTPGPSPGPSPSPTYSLISTPTTTNEGAIITVTLNTNQTGSFPYLITGISTADIGGASLSGSFSGNGDSKTFNVSNDSLTEGSETFTLSLTNGLASTSVVINDSSVTPTPTPTPTPPPAPPAPPPSPPVTSWTITKSSSAAVTGFWDPPRTGSYTITLGGLHGYITFDLEVTSSSPGIGRVGWNVSSTNTLRRNMISDFTGTVNAQMGHYGGTGQSFWSDISGVAEVMRGGAPGGLGGGPTNGESVLLGLSGYGGSTGGNGPGGFYLQGPDNNGYGGSGRTGGAPRTFTSMERTSGIIIPSGPITSGEGGGGGLYAGGSGGVIHAYTAQAGVTSSIAYGGGGASSMVTGYNNPNVSNYSWGIGQSAEYLNRPVFSAVYNG